MKGKKRIHGNDGRYARKPPPWKYKPKANQTLNVTANDRYDLRLFLANKRLRTTNKIIPPTSRVSSTPDLHHPVLHRSTSVFVDSNATEPYDRITIIPPIDRLNNHTPSSCSTPTHTSQRHDPHARHKLPDQHTSARHPSDSKQYPLQHASYSGVTKTHPSDKHTSDRQPSDNTTTPITRPTDFTWHIEETSHTNYMYHTVPFLTLEYVSHTSHEFPCTTGPSTILPPTHSNFQTPNIIRTEITDCAHLICPTSSDFEDSLSMAPIYSSHKFLSNTPPLNQPVERRWIQPVRQQKIPRTPHTRRNSDRSISRPSPPSYTPPMIAPRHPMARQFRLWCTIIAFLPTKHRLVFILCGTKR